MYHYASNKKIVNGEETRVPNIQWTDVVKVYLLKFGAMPDLLDNIQPNIDVYLTAEEAMWFGVVTSIED